MFFNGDLQSGIALAISESKLVACFIRDDEEESSSWEDVYLQDDEIAPLLRSKTVLLRMNTGSQEAGFLSAFCPINKTPTLVIIHNGQLREYLVAGIAPDDFKQRLKAALTEQPSTTHPQDSQATPEPPSQQPTTVSQQSTRLIPAPVQAPAPPDTTPSNATVQNLLHDRRDRLEAEKKRREDAERADRQAKAKARREDAAGAEAGGASPGSFKSQELSYAQQQRKRQQDARQERDRIMRQIENDKADRREREERRRALARAEAGATDGADGLVDQQISSENVQRPASTRSSKDCAVQVRLLDGSTIRSRFPSDQTLRSHVRAWADEQRSDGDTPYTFKQILAPQPNRAITISEEEESLQTLGFTPSATLVMVPVQGSIAAYGSGESGLLSRGLSAGYGFVSGGVGMVTGALGTFLGVAQVAPPSNASSGPSTPAGQNASGSINVRTLRDQQTPRDDHQLYNGNQLNFEPRKDQDDKKD